MIPVAIAGIGPILFITAEPLACFSSHAEFDNILDACEGIINPSFTAQVHMICFGEAGASSEATLKMSAL